MNIDDAEREYERLLVGREDVVRSMIIGISHPKGSLNTFSKDLCKYDPIDRKELMRTTKIISLDDKSEPIVA